MQFCFFFLNYYKLHIRQYSIITILVWRKIKNVWKITRWVKFYIFKKDASIVIYQNILKTVGNNYKKEKTTLVFFFMNNFKMQNILHTFSNSKICTPTYKIFNTWDRKLCGEQKRTREERGMLKKFSIVLRKCKFFRTNQMEIARKRTQGVKILNTKSKTPHYPPFAKNFFCSELLRSQKFLTFFCQW